MTERTMYRGDTYAFDIQVTKRSAGSEIGVPENITDWKLWFTAKRTYSDWDSMAAVRLSSEPNDGIIFIDPVNGKAEITIPPVKTVGYPDGPVVLVYDVQAKDTNGRIFTVEGGTLTVIPDVTRAIT
jgi:hypothetical protein